MAAWRQSWVGEVGLRFMGLALCGLAYLALSSLMTMQAPPPAADLTAYGLAAIGSLAASAALIPGRLLFDQINVSSQWRGGCGDVRPLTFPSGDRAMRQSAEPELLVIGKDVDNSWTVRESAGRLVARFASERAARGYAAAQRRGQPSMSVVSSAGFRPRIAGRLTLGMVRPAAVNR